MRGMRHWNTLPGEVVDACTLETFKASLEGGLITLVWWNVSLLIALGFELDYFKGPFEPKPSYDSAILQKKVSETDFI